MIDVSSILGKPWVERSCDPEIGLDCAGVVTWAMRELGVPDALLPVWPGDATDIKAVTEASREWVEVPLNAKMRAGDVVLAASGRTYGNRPHLLVVVNESPCVVATSVERDGVVVKPASRIVGAQGLYRWPAVARIVGAPLEYYRQ